MPDDIAAFASIRAIATRANADDAVFRIEFFDGVIKKVFTGDFHVPFSFLRIGIIRAEAHDNGIEIREFLLIDEFFYLLDG